MKTTIPRAFRALALTAVLVLVTGVLAGQTPPDASPSDDVINVSTVDRFPAGTYLNPVNRLISYEVVELPDAEKTAVYEYAASASGVTLDLLEELVFTGESAVAENRYAGSRPVQEFLRVMLPSRENREVWVDARWMVSGGVAGVVLADTPEFSVPLLQAAGARSISRGTVVVVHPEPGGAGGFVRVTGWDEEQNLPVIGTLTLAANVSMLPADVLVAARIRSVRAIPLVGDAQKLVVLQLPFAEGVVPAVSAFAQEYREYVAELGGSEVPAAAAVPATPVVPMPRDVPFHTHGVLFPAAGGTIISPRVNVRDFPSIEDTAIVTTLVEGDRVTVNAMSYLRYRVNGETGYWFRIDSPVAGWVFGSLIDFD